MQYKLEKMDTASGVKGHWTACGQSDSTSMTVIGLEAGHKYQFRVRAVNAEGDSDPLTLEEPSTAYGIRLPIILERHATYPHTI